jgi:hypothetical protein
MVWQSHFHSLHQLKLPMQKLLKQLRIGSIGLIWGINFTDARHNKAIQATATAGVSGWNVYLAESSWALGLVGATFALFGEDGPLLGLSPEGGTSAGGRFQGRCFRLFFL